MAEFIPPKTKEKVKKMGPVLFSRLLWLLGGMMIGWFVFRVGPSLRPTEVGSGLFCKAHLCGGKGRGINDKIKSAGRLAKQKNAEVWTVLLLLDDDLHRYILYNYNSNHPTSELDAETALKIRTSMDKAEKGIVAEVLMNVPENCHKAVLWAVTTKLLDHGVGYRSYGGSIGPIPYVFAHGATDPIRDIARKTLKKCLLVDHEYDPLLWREAILRKGDSSPNSTDGYGY